MFDGHCMVELAQYALGLLRVVGAEAVASDIDGIRTSVGVIKAVASFEPPRKVTADNQLIFSGTRHLLIPWA